MMPPTSMPPAPMPEGGALTQEEMLSNLQGMMGKVEDKYRDLNGQRFSSSNTNEEEKRAAMKQAIMMLQKYGVDFSKPESVTRFLDKLYKANPDAYELFEAAFNALLGNDADGGMNTQEPNADLPPAVGEGAPGVPAPELF